MGGVQRGKEPEMRIKLLAKVVSTAGAHKVGDVVVLADEHCAEDGSVETGRRGGRRRESGCRTSGGQVGEVRGDKSIENGRVDGHRGL